MKRAQIQAITKGQTNTLYITTSVVQSNPDALFNAIKLNRTIRTLIVDEDGGSIFSFNFSCLAHLKLTRVKITRRYLEMLDQFESRMRFFEIISRLTTLKYFIYYDVNRGSQDVMINLVCQNNPRLKHVSVHSGAVYALTHGHLRHLTLSQESDSQDIQALYRVIDSNPIETLTIYSLTCETMRAILPCLMKISKLKLTDDMKWKVENFDMIRALVNDGNLSDLKVECFRYGKRMIVELGQFLSHDGQLTRLKLTTYDETMSSKDLAVLCQALRTNTGLRTFKLDYMDMYVEELDDLFRPVFEVNETLSSIIIECKSQRSTMVPDLCQRNVNNQKHKAVTLTSLLLAAV